MSPTLCEILVDPEVSIRKFEKEVESVLTIKEDLRKRGWIIEKHEYPLVRVTFIGRHILPRVTVGTVDIDFTNYDVIAPSVRFLDPFTLETAMDHISYQQVPPNLRKHPIRGTYLKDGKPFDIILKHAENGMPFICLPGVREYHSHPQHTDDSWHEHRKKMSGNILHHLLETIDSCCVDPMKGLVLNINVNVASNVLLGGYSFPNEQ